MLKEIQEYYYQRDNKNNKICFRKTRKAKSQPIRRVKTRKFKRQDKTRNMRIRK